MNLTQLFGLSFEQRREEIALEFEGKEYSFGEIDRRSNCVAGLLASRGFQKGDRLGIYLANCIEMIDLFLACLKLGVIFVPINILYREREITHILADAEPRAVISSGELPGGAPSWNVKDLSTEAKRFSNDLSKVSLDGDDAAAIIYTSGTTGTSKGAILTHNNFAANAVNLVTCWQFTPEDRLLLALPLFHVHGLGNGVLCWLVSGCRLRLLERFEHQRAEAVFEEFQPTVFFGVPTIYVRLLELSIRAPVRLFVSGSAPLPGHILEEFRVHFGHTILERYGMTETMMNISNPYVGERRAGTVGFPLPGVSIQIRDSEGHVLGDEAEGELYVRGPNVFHEYWRRPDATAAAFSGGFFRTGDMGVRSKDGYYTLKGRASDLIISGGFNIYPREIEEFLLEQTGVKEAAVVGMPDRVRGEIPVAYLVIGEGFNAEHVEQRCRAELASFKVPRSFIPVSSLPRTALGKIQKHLLPSAV